jgi:hypothetical protein
MKKVSTPKVVTALEASESPLPPAIQEALGEWQLPGRDSHPLATTSLCQIIDQHNRPPTLGAPAASN